MEKPRKINVNGKIWLWRIRHNSYLNLYCKETKVFIQEKLSDIFEESIGPQLVRNVIERSESEE